MESSLDRNTTGAEQQPTGMLREANPIGCLNIQLERRQNE
jgi:hypothetical protein